MGLGKVLSRLIVEVGADTQGLVSGLQSADGAVKKTGEGLGGLVKQGLAMGAGFFAIQTGMEGVKGVLDGTIGSMERWQDADDELERKTGLTGDALKGLQDIMANVYKQTPSSLTTVTDVMSDLYRRTGAAGQTLQDLTLKMVEFSRLTGGDASASVAGFTQMMNEWNVPVEKGAALLDALYVASQKTGVGLDQITGSLVTAGPALRSFGFTTEQAVALVANFQKEGVNTDQALASMRIGLGKMAKAGEPLTETFQRVIASIKDAKTEGEALGYGIDVFGARGGATLTKAIRDGALDYDTLTAAMANSDGAIMESAKNTENFGEKWTLFRHKIDVALRPIDMAALQMIDDLMDQVGKGLDYILPKLEKWADEFSNSSWAADLRANFAEFKEYVGDLRDKAVPAMEAFGEILQDKVMPPLEAFGDFLSKHKEEVKAFALGIILGVVVPAFIAWAVAAGTAAVATVIALAPVLLTAAAMGLMGVAIYEVIKHWKDLRDIFYTVKDAVMGFIEQHKVLTAILLAPLYPLVAIGVAIYEVIKHWRTLRDVIEEVATWVKQKLQEFVSWISFEFGPLWGKLVDRWQADFAALKLIVTAVVKALVSDFNAIKTAVTAVITFVHNLIEQHMDQIKVVWNAAWTVIRQVLENQWELIKNRVETVMRMVHDVINIVLALIRGDWGAAWGALKDLLGDAFHGVETELRLRLQMLQTILSDAWQVVKWAAVVAWNELKDLIMGILNGAIDEAKDIGKKIGQALVDGLKSIPGVGKAMDLAGKAGGFLSDLAGHASGILNSPTAHLALTGEKGPELAFIPKGTSVFPAGETRQMLAGAGGGKQGGSVFAPSLQLSATFAANFAQMKQEMLQAVADWLDDQQARAQQSGQLNPYTSGSATRGGRL